MHEKTGINLKYHSVNLGYTAHQDFVCSKNSLAEIGDAVTTSPAGSNNEFQYNNSGSFGATSTMKVSGDDIYFYGAATSAYWDKSANAFHFNYSSEAEFGNNAYIRADYNGGSSAEKLVIVGETAGIDMTGNVAITGALTVSTNATITGNLTVSGTTTTINTQTLDVEDKNVVIGKVSSPSDTTADGGGWTLKGASDKTFNWVNATDAWTSSEHIHLIDNKKLLVGGASGTADGLEIVHNGSNSILNDSGTGTLQLQLGGSTKLEVTSGGINVTGEISVGGSPLASGNTVDLVADGAIGAGKPVIIKSNGKVAQVGETVTENTSQSSVPTSGSNGTQMNGNGNTNPFTSVVFSETSNIGCSFFNDNNTGQNLKGRYWNINSSGNANIPSAANTTVLNATYYQIDSCWDSTNNKFFIAAKKDSDNKVWGTWVSVSSSGITASGNTFELVGVDANMPKCIDCGSGRIAVAYNVYWSGGGVYQPYVHMLNWNGSSNYETSGGHTAVDSSGTSSNPSEDIDIAWHASESKIVAVYHNASNAVGCRIGTITGSAGNHYTSWGSEVTVASGAELPKVIVDVNTGKVVVTYVYTSNNTIYSKVGTISGTSISFGSEVQVNPGNTVDANERGNFRPELIYVKNLEKVLYAWVSNISSTYYTLTITGTVSGTSISWANNFQHWNTGVGIRGVTMCDLNDSSTNKVVIGGRNDSNSDKGEFKTIALSSAVTNITAQNCIGFAPSAISDTNTGTINLDGNTVDNQSGLTAGTRYWVANNGTLATTAVTTQAGGVALSSSKLLIKMSA